MKTVILGANGQLGRQLGRTLPGEVIALSHADADVTSAIVLRQTLAQLRPRFVVNAAGYTQVDKAEAHPAEAFAVNAIALRDLASICHDLDSTLIQVSTDYVFGLDAARVSPYRETDAPGPLSAYGHSKLAGEHFVRALCPKHFILRTCGLYGPGHSNFVHTMLRQAKEAMPLRVVDDQICTPTAALDLAHAVAELLASQAYGLYHVTNSGACSWHEFARMIFAIKKMDVTLVPITSDQYGAPARRPRYSVLSNARWIGQGFTPLRSWQEALESYLAMRPE